MSIWLLFEKADKSGLAIPLAPPEPSTGKRKREIQSITVTVFPDDDDGNLLSLVTVGVEQANYLMFREDLFRQLDSVRFNLENIPSNIIGSSADLAFALATITEILPIDKGCPPYPPFAATGVLDENGSVNKVEGISAKLHAGLSVIKPGGIIFFPDANNVDITVEIEKLAEKKRVELCSVKRLDEAVSKLGHPISKIEPYLGLKPYTYKHRNVYCGREQEIIEICNKLNKNANERAPGLIIVAASGVGKSSLVQAGVLPALVQAGFNQVKADDGLENKTLPVIWAVSRPTELGNLGNEAESCAIIRKAWMNQCSPELLDLPEVKSWAQLGKEITMTLAANHRFVWVLDQLEELFTLEQFEDISVDESLKRFIEFLSQLQSKGVWIIATLRNDYYSQYQGIPELLTIFKDKQYDLLNGQSAMLSKIINQPAALADLVFGFEDHTNTDNEKHIQLNEQIFEDMKGSTQGLPFLSLTLQLLFEKREQNKLTYKAYRDIDRLEGAIKTHTENTVASLKTSKKKPITENLLLDILEKLVGLNATGNKSFRISSPLESFSQDEQFIVRQLIDSRLLTTKRENNQTIVELALDCLLEEWPEVKSAIKRRKEEFKKRQRLIDDAEYWNATGQDKNLLIKNYEKVIEAELQLHHNRHYFSSVTESYVENSMLKTRKRYRGIWITLCLFCGFFFYKEIISIIENNIEGVYPSLIFISLTVTPFFVWLLRTFKKKSYIYTLKKENYTNLILLFITLAVTVIYFIREFELQNNGFLSLYSNELWYGLILLILPLNIFIRYKENLRLIINLTSNSFSEKSTNKSSKFSLKRLNISPNSILVLSTILWVFYLQDDIIKNNPNDILLFSYNSYINTASFHIDNKNIKKAGFFLEKAETTLKLIPINSYNYDLIHDRLYHLRLSANLAYNKKDYSENEKNVKECIKIGQELLDENSVRNLNWFFADSLKIYLDNLNSKNNFKYSRAINQYAMCVGKAVSWYTWGEHYAKALSLNLRAINLYGRAIKIAPNDTDYSGNLAVAYLVRGNLYLWDSQEDLAIEQYNKSQDILLEMKSLGKNSSSLEETLIWLYRTKAEFYIKSDSLQKAEEFLNKALRLSQKNYKNDSENIESYKLINEIEKEINEMNNKFQSKGVTNTLTITLQ